MGSLVKCCSWCKTNVTSSLKDHYLESQRKRDIFLVLLFFFSPPHFADHTDNFQGFFSLSQTLYVCVHLQISAHQFTTLFIPASNRAEQIFPREFCVSSLASSSRCMTIPSSLFKCTAHCSKSHLAVLGLPGIELVFFIAAHIVLCVSALFYSFTWARILGLHLCLLNKLSQRLFHPVSGEWLKFACTVVLCCYVHWMHSQKTTCCWTLDSTGEPWFRVNPCSLSLLTLLKKKNNQTTNNIKNSKPTPPHFLFWKRLTRKEVYWALWQPHSCCGAPSIHAKSHISFSLLSSRQEGARQAPSFLPLLSLEDIPTPPSPQLGTAQSKGLWLKEARLKAWVVQGFTATKERHTHTRWRSRNRYPECFVLSDFVSKLRSPFHKGIIHCEFWHASCRFYKLKLRTESTFFTS